MATTQANKKVKGRIAANIGLEDGALKEVVSVLNHRLADSMVLYAKTRNYHWNVTGMEFIQLHDLFETQYDQIEAAIDEIAERVRTIGGVALGTLEEFKKNSALEEQPGQVPNAEEMLQNLLNDHETMIRQLREDADKTEELNDMGTNDFLIGLMTDHEKMAWMLRAHLENLTK